MNKRSKAKSTRAEAAEIMASVLPGVIGQYSKPYDAACHLLAALREVGIELRRSCRNGAIVIN
jgi:hypothetical protein